MKRPYAIDTDGIVHEKDSSCHYTPSGDSTFDGVITGMVEEGYGICDDCLSRVVKRELFRVAANKVSQP